MLAGYHGSFKRVGHVAFLHDILSQNKKCKDAHFVIFFYFPSLSYIYTSQTK